MRPVSLILTLLVTGLLFPAQSLARPANKTSSPTDPIAPQTQPVDEQLELYDDCFGLTPTAMKTKFAALGDSWHLISESDQVFIYQQLGEKDVLEDDETYYLALTFEPGMGLIGLTHQFVLTEESTQSYVEMLQEEWGMPAAIEEQLLDHPVVYYEASRQRHGGEFGITNVQYTLETANVILIAFQSAKTNMVFIDLVVVPPEQESVTTTPEAS